MRVLPSDAAGLLQSPCDRVVVLLLRLMLVLGLCTGGVVSHGAEPQDGQSNRNQMDCSSWNCSTAAI